MEATTPEDNAKLILDRLRLNGLWEPAGLGLSYMKTGDRSLKLVQQEKNPTASQARIRMSILMKDIGWKVDESEVEMVDIEHLSPQERHMQEMMKRQEVAQNWPCPECVTPLAAFPLEEGVWKFEGEEDMELPTGDTEKVERWVVVIKCPVCDTSVPMEPYDYGLLAGDDAMVVYRANTISYTALSRPEIIDFIDNKLTDSLVITGTFCAFSGELLPPHVRGAVVVFSSIEEEE